MTIPSLHLRDVGDPRRFHRHWPRIDTDTWPGREFYWAYTHPTLTLLLLVVSVIVLAGAAHDLVMR